MRILLLTIRFTEYTIVGVYEPCRQRKLGAGLPAHQEEKKIRMRSCHQETVETMSREAETGRTRCSQGRHICHKNRRRRTNDAEKQAGRGIAPERSAGIQIAVVLRAQPGKYARHSRDHNDPGDTPFRDRRRSQKRLCGTVPSAVRCCNDRRLKRSERSAMVKIYAAVCLSRGGTQVPK